VLVPEIAAREEMVMCLAEEPAMGCIRRAAEGEGDVVVNLEASRGRAPGPVVGDEGAASPVAAPELAAQWRGDVARARGSLLVGDGPRSAGVATAAGVTRRERDLHALGEEDLEGGAGVGVTERVTDIVEELQEVRADGHLDEVADGRRRGGHRRRDGRRRDERR